MKAFAPSGAQIVGTSEIIMGTAMAGEYHRNPDGSIEPVYDGETDVCWDSQRTEEREGQTVYLDENGEEWLESQIVIREEETAAA